MITDAELAAEYRDVMTWARPRLRARLDDLKRLAHADPHDLLTGDDRALIKAALLYVAARVLADDV